MKAPTIFISYRRQDSGDATGRIYDRLVQHYGREAIFKDVDSIPLGADFRGALDKAVGQCNLLLAVIGRQWLSSQNESGARRLDDSRDFVRIEIESAMRRDIPVIPLLVQGAGMPGENDLPQSLQALVFRNAIPIRPDPDFHHDIDRLIKGVELHFKNNS
ncbi:MAG TPA: toll/interleukin-1 receptor domain-containing protein [Blastocatellia bacterium]|nr:toll/interleukin-1 receptor domain-containing protein [Blastocatellia bacterium]